MENNKTRFQNTERLLTYILIGCAAMFVIYLFAAGFGVIWLKAITAIIAIITSGLCLAYLYITKLLLAPRSFWMTVAAGSLLICLLFSLILGFPSPL